MSADQTDQSPYFLTLTLSVLDHLSEGLYSSVSAVITEAVANAWDADATLIEIQLDIPNDYILIKDNGVGMNTTDINNRYLRVGYQKRREMDTTPSGRAVMGRKGIGKLSLFSIANQIHVETRKSSSESEALLIDVPNLRQQVEAKESEVYRPPTASLRHDDWLSDTGTVIELTKLRTNRLTGMNASGLRRKIARRFSVVGSENFSVYVNGNPITTNDRADLKFSQYLWVFDGTELDTSPAKNLLKQFTLPNRPAQGSVEEVVKGWIGTVDRPSQLKTVEGNLNSIVVLARGRLVDEDILPRISNAEIYTKYVTGQIEADYLDETGADDIVTSDRQRLREDEIRVQALLAHAKEQMRTISNQWTDLRRGEKTDELREKFPKIDEWLNRLDEGWRKKANNLLSRIATMEVDDNDNPEQARKDLIRHSIYGFERLRLRGNAEELSTALDGDINSLLILLASRDALEAAHYRDIVTSRLEAIRDFRDLVNEDEKELVLERWLFKSLWLLDPAWDRATEDTAKEMQLRLLEPFSDNDDSKAKYGRVDIKYRNVAGKSVLVELKRRSATPSIGVLVDQVKKYFEAYKSKFPNESAPEVAIVVGKDIPDAEKVVRSVIPGSKVMTYDELIIRAEGAYGEYLDRTREIDFIEQALDEKD